MPIQFSGWEVFDDGAAFTGVLLQPNQRPLDQGAYTMYHGTSVANAKLIIANGFKQSQTGMLGKGVYVSRSFSKAAAYPKDGSVSDRVILELHVRVGRVKRIDKDNHPLQFTWNKEGYDTAWVPPNCRMQSVPSGLEEDCVYDPRRVRVVSIAKAPNDTIERDLEQLLSTGNSTAPQGCALCQRNTQQGSPHVQQQCWKCGKNICILMSKHFCP